MTDTATVADAFKLAFYEAIKELMANDPETPHVYVTFGWPGTLDPADIVSFLGVTSEQSAATMSTNRSREESLQLEVSISCFVGGGQEAELVAS